MTEIEQTGVLVKPGSSPRVRIRTLVRHGWYVVDVPLPQADPVYIKETRYKMLTNWCSANVPETDWSSGFNVSGPSINGRTTRFVFKDEKFVTWFKLMLETK